MSQELFYLALTAVLNALLWIPVVIGYVRTRGFLQPADYVTAPDSPLPDWVNRANRAHMNAVENLSPFAAIVLVGFVTGFSNQTTEILAAIFFFSRAAHAVIQISGFSKFMARTVAFGIGNTATLLLGFFVIRHLLA